jgi:cyclic pyranopterin phosphate synthase
MAGPIDVLGRPIKDLRISVTDRCNFRCTYCMPKEIFGREYQFLERAELLTFEEIERVARSFVTLGVNKIRLTGGEPLLRRDIDLLVSMLSPLGAELALTTNGSLLARLAPRLKAAGLDRVTVSLDSLDDRVFAEMNEVDFPVERVLAGIEAAASSGLAPIKVNMVVRRGVNENSIVDMARYFHGSGHVLRFIEYMDVGHTNGWRLEDVVPATEILAALNESMPVEPVGARYPSEVARRYRYVDGGGEVGIIASVTQPFCSTCTRARLSADGRLYTCLFASAGTDLRGPLRRGATDDELAATLSDVWTVRGDRYSEIRSAATAREAKVEMSYIGG